MTTGTSFIQKGRLANCNTCTRFKFCHDNQQHSCPAADNDQYADHTGINIAINKATSV